MNFTVTVDESLRDLPGGIRTEDEKERISTYKGCLLFRDVGNMTLKAGTEDPSTADLTKALKGLEESGDSEVEVEWKSNKGKRQWRESRGGGLRRMGGGAAAAAAAAGAPHGEAMGEAVEAVKKVVYEAIGKEFFRELVVR